MKKNLLIFAAFFLISYFLFGNNVEIFFAQDDFILIDKFSQNNFLVDVQNIFSFSETHFRPVHNFYFFVLGNLFGKNYASYHLASLLIHSLSGLMVLVLAKRFFKNSYSPFVASFFYLVNSSHFVSLYWISGNSVEIGFLLFSLSLYFWISRKFGRSIFFLLPAILASEAFLMGALVFGGYEFTRNARLQNIPRLVKTFLFTLLVGVIRLIYLTPKGIYDTYNLDFSLKIFSTMKYYLLRIAGFSELSEDFFVSLVLVGFWGFLIKKFIDAELDIKNVGFFLILLIVGFFPFILLPYHLSPHYMNLSIFGLSFFVAVAMGEARRFNYLLLTAFLIVSIVNTYQLGNNHWVVIKSRIAEAYIRQIEDSLDSAQDGSTLVFNNNRISSSLDAYLALGGGKAIDFWFREKKFRYCFSEFESCDSLP